MPRKRQASAQQGNRTDLGSPVSNLGAPTPSEMQPPNTTQPVAVATGQAYGVAGQQRAAEQAMPLGATPNPPVVPAAPVAPPQPAGPYQGSELQQGLLSMSGEQIGVGGPSRRPDQHIMEGVNSGPSSVTAPSGLPAGSVAQTLARLAASDPAMAQLAALARNQGV